MRSLRRRNVCSRSNIVKRDDLPSVKALDMSYKPKMKAQPTLQFQTNLNFGADLPAVAADANCEGDENVNSIAPTVFQANLPALPSIEDSMPVTKAPPSNSGTSVNNPPPAPSNTQTEVNKAPPPPPATDAK